MNKRKASVVIWRTQTQRELSDELLECGPGLVATSPAIISKIVSINITQGSR